MENGHNTCSNLSVAGKVECNYPFKHLACDKHSLHFEPSYLYAISGFGWQVRLSQSCILPLPQPLVSLRVEVKEDCFHDLHLDLVVKIALLSFIAHRICHGLVPSNLGAMKSFPSLSWEGYLPGLGLFCLVEVSDSEKPVLRAGSVLESAPAEKWDKGGLQPELRTPQPRGGFRC